MTGNEIGFKTLIGIISFCMLNYYFSILIHEVGHLILGIIGKYRFLAFCIGKLALVKTKSGFRIRVRKGQYSAGQCLFSPSKQILSPAIMLFGGILFNILSGIFFLLLTKGYDIEWKRVCIYSGLFNILAGLSNLIFTKQTSVYQDGKSISELRTKEDAKCFLAQMKISQELVNGIPYRDMEEELFILPDTKRISSYVLEMYLHRYYRFLDLGMPDDAMSCLLELKRISSQYAFLRSIIEREENFLCGILKEEQSIRADIKIKSRSNLTPHELRVFIGEIGVDDVLKILETYKSYIFQGEIESTRNIIELYFSKEGANR